MTCVREFVRCVEQKDEDDALLRPRGPRGVDHLLSGEHSDQDVMALGGLEVSSNWGVVR